ncbi:MAG: NAD-dependent epimerase/dehydratase family protein [Polaromonas sp.]|nr:NAD-dependent epimerase/dehydratase family protein [Polaromonas sp.]
MSKMRKILITGSSGHLGSAVLKKLRNHYEVHAIVRLEPHAKAEGVVYHAIDLSRDWSITKLPKRIDAVVHLAQSRNYRDFPERALEVFWLNTGTTALLLQYAHQAGASQFILASSGGLYQPATSVIDEQTPLRPPIGNLAYYFRSKRAAELLAEAYSTILHTTILRPFFIYGPDQAPEKLIARLIDRVRERLPVQIAGNGGLKINPIHVDDASEIIGALLASSVGSQILNVAGPDVVSIREIAETAGKLLGIQPKFEQVVGREEMLVADHGAVRALLNREMTSFPMGMRSIISLPNT